MKLIPVCAWCQRDGWLTVLDETPQEEAAKAAEAGNLSHGICPDHADELRKEAGLR